MLAVSCGALLPIGNWAHRDIHLAEQPEKSIPSYSLLCDEDFLRTYQLKLVEGRDAKTKGSRHRNLFPKPVDVVEIVVNQKFVRQVGLSHPIGTLLSDGTRQNANRGDRAGLPLSFTYEPIQPVMIGSDLPGVSFTPHRPVPGRETKRDDPVPATITRKPSPGNADDYQEYPYSELYEREIILGHLVYIFTGIALLIGGMGVLAFSVFIAESKTKEIALRKVNGASEGQIMIYLNSYFRRAVAIACIVGISCSYLICRQWLQGFA